MRRLLVIAIALLCLAGMVSIAMADEGMWLFNVAADRTGQGQVRIHAHQAVAGSRAAFVGAIQ